MKVELPEFKRCCCCLPLRYGLLAAGYIKLGFTFVLLASILYVLMIYTMILVGFRTSIFIPEVILTVLTGLLLVFDICMTIVFLVGGHTKNVKLLHIFYIYSIVILCILTLLFAVSTGFELHLIRRYINGENNANMYYVFITYTKILCLITFLGVGVYVILLLRSEIKKLRSNCNFRFVNVANEVQCTMENGFNEHDNKTDDLKNGTDDAKHGINCHDNGIIDQKKGTNDQFEETKEIDHKTFNYTKL